MILLRWLIRWENVRARTAMCLRKERLLRWYKALPVSGAAWMWDFHGFSMLLWKDTFAGSLFCWWRWLCDPQQGGVARGASLFHLQPIAPKCAGKLNIRFWPPLKIQFSFSWFPLPQPALQAAYSAYPGSSVPWDARHTSKKNRSHCLQQSLVPNQMIIWLCLLFNLPQYLQFASSLLPSKLPGKVRSQRGRLLCTEHNPEEVKFPVLQ